MRLNLAFLLPAALVTAPAVVDAQAPRKKKKKKKKKKKEQPTAGIPRAHNRSRRASPGTSVAASLYHPASQGLGCQPMPQVHSRRARTAPRSPSSETRLSCARRAAS
jgi:hypothetical protein